MSGRIEVFKTHQELRRWRKGLDRDRRIGFVPTMGALHEGHGVLLDRMRETTETRVLSIFVNPMQFAPEEDLAKYPRTLEADLALAESRGVDIAFAPEPSELYPPGFSTYVEETRLSQPLCGAFRPGHFRGVTTIVLKLLNLVAPSTAFFGLKDAQQFLVLKKMVRDLEMSVELVGVPTVREPDGLALSSRNRFLSAQERERAPMLYRSLNEAVAALKQANDSRIVPGHLSKKILESARVHLSAQGFQVQYFDWIELAEPEGEARSLLAVAAFLGKTRLIDNVFF